jgi:hypothetical protein
MVVSRIHAEVIKALVSSELKERAAAEGADVYHRLSACNAAV